MFEPCSQCGQDAYWTITSPAGDKKPLCGKCVKEIVDPDYD